MNGVAIEAPSRKEPVTASLSLLGGLGFMASKFTETLNFSDWMGARQQHRKEQQKQKGCRRQDEEERNRRETAGKEHPNEVCLRRKERIGQKRRKEKKERKQRKDKEAVGTDRKSERKLRQ